MFLRFFIVIVVLLELVVLADANNQRFLTLEEDQGQVYLRGYKFSSGFANKKILRRKLNALIEGVDQSSKIEVAEFGQSWGNWQIVTLTNLKNKVLIQVFEPPQTQEQERLNLLSSIEISFEEETLNYVDMLCFDGLDLSYDQVHLYCSSDSGISTVTLVAPSQAKGTWRQTNWRSLKVDWPKSNFQLINFRESSWELYDSNNSKYQLKNSNNELNEYRFRLSEPRDLFIPSNSPASFKTLDVDQRLLLQLSASLEGVEKSHLLEFEGFVIDLIAFAGGQVQEDYVLKPRLSWSKSTRLTPEGLPWASWVGENEPFNIHLELSYFGLNDLDRGELNWKIWWQVPSPSWDLKTPRPLPDQSGIIRRPLASGDQMVFEREFRWPYEMKDETWVDIGGDETTEYWTVAIVESKSGDLRARVELPWLSKPIRLKSEVNQVSLYKSELFFNDLKEKWKQSGGQERTALHFEGFFPEVKELTHSIETSKFWSGLQPWSQFLKAETFDDLWVASWNKAGVTFTWPNWEKQIDLFDEWMIHVNLADEKPLRHGNWSLINEYGEVMVRREIFDGVTAVMHNQKENFLKNLWKAKQVKEVIYDHDRARSYQLRTHQAQSGAEKLGWLWVNHGSKVLEERQLPWQSETEVWDSVQELFHQQGQWHIGLEDRDKFEMQVLFETPKGRVTKAYPFNWAYLQMPINLNQGDFIHALWFQKHIQNKVTTSPAFPLFPIDEIISIESQSKQLSTWLVNRNEKCFLLSWKNLSCEESIEITDLANFYPIRAKLHHPGHYLILLQKSYQGHRLLSYAPQYQKNPVLGGDQSQLSNANDFCVIGEDKLQPMIVAGDLNEHQLKLFSSEWKLIDQWGKSGFSPSALIVDPIHSNQFWVLDRREKSQSFLYLFELEKQKLKLLKAFLTPLQIGKAKDTFEKGFELILKDSSDRHFYMVDPEKKMVLEYKLGKDRQDLEFLRAYDQSVREQGSQPFFQPKDLLRIKWKDKTQLYLSDAKDSLLRIK